jgi:hypothetical protein
VRNDKVNPREDEQRRHELGALLQGTPIEGRDEERVQEAVGRVNTAHRPESAEPASDGRSIDERWDRAEFARWFEPSWFPATAPELADRAVGRSAPDWLTGALARFPADRRVATIGELYDLASATGDLGPAPEDGWDA